MSAARDARGREAEALAEAFLQRRGYRVLQRRFRAPAGEVDLIAWSGATLVFVEVRSRSSDKFGTPLESIGPQKCVRIVRAARAYLQHLAPPWPPMRFDVVGINWSRTQAPNIVVVCDAFDAGGARHVC